MTQTEAARGAIEQAARAAYGRLLAYLCARSRDIAAAEDALGEALLSALTHWPEHGLPAAPEAWLLTTARRKLTDRARRAAVAAKGEAELVRAAEELALTDDFPDDRLKLLFVCAHPAIDAAARTPLMLQTVLGLNAARIASAFLTAPEAMGKRLVRAKAKIREAGLAFATPEREDLPARLEAVLEAIYAAFGAGWDDDAGAGEAASGLAGEALFLADLVARLLPDESEPHALRALMLHAQARRAARRDAAGAFVPLAAQDSRLWSRPLIAEAEAALARAAARGPAGRFQLEAILQSLHASRAAGGATPWAAIVQIYDLIAARTPTVGALVARAAALGEARGPEAGLAALAALDPARTRAYQPYWAAHAHLLAAAGRPAEAADAYARAAGLTSDPAVRAFLLARRAGLPEAYRNEKAHRNE